MTENDGYGGNSNLKRVGEEIEYGEYEANELVKCVNDPVYFIKKYVKIVNVDKGLVPFDMWDFQSDLVNSFHNNRFNIVRYPRQSGKCLQKDTYIVLRNKKTGEVINTTIEDFYERTKVKQIPKI